MGNIDYKERVEKALDLARELSGFDGAHHKMYAIDQIVRALTGCPMVTLTSKFNPAIQYEGQGESEEYLAWVRDFEDGEDGPNTYEWDEGCPP
jgi:hypothetical protein